MCVSYMCIGFIVISLKHISYFTESGRNLCSFPSCSRRSLKLPEKKPTWGGFEITGVGMKRGFWVIAKHGHANHLGLVYTYLWYIHTDNLAIWLRWKQRKSLGSVCTHKTHINILYFGRCKPAPLTIGLIWLKYCQYYFSHNHSIYPDHNQVEH